MVVGTSFPWLNPKSWPRLTIQISLPEPLHPLLLGEAQKGSSWYWDLKVATMGLPQNKP